MLTKYLLAGIGVSTTLVSAVDVTEKLYENIKKQVGADAGFTQDGCDETNPFYVGVLPGFTETVDQPWPCSYAGTLASDASGDHQLFFWMYPAYDADAPVAIWLNGGPGASSTFANFLFSSPLRISESSDSVFTMYRSDETWIEKATMIYIDQPVGTGFSYGEPLLTNMEEASTEFVQFVTNIWAAFPDLQSKDLYMTGESYAGKYIPAFSWALHENGNFNLKASLIGDPYTAPLTQRTNTWRVPNALNVIDDSNMPQIQALIKTCQESLAVDLRGSADYCSNIIGYVSETSGDVFPYDNRIFGVDWDPIEDPVTNYFTVQPAATLDQIWQLIHVEDSTKTPVFQMSSSEVGNAFVMDNLIDYSNYVEKLVAAESPVLIYAGEFDAQDGPKTQEYWLRKLNFTGSEDFWSQSRQIYWVQNFTNQETTQLINGGYWRTSPYFEYLTVPKAGHFVPNNYFSTSFEFFSDYIDNKALVCHKTDGNMCSVVSIRCDYMNQCNGHGTCNQATGTCDCDAGYKFGDCSKSVIELTDAKKETINMYGPGWFTMAFSGNSTSTLYVTPNVTSDIYIMKGYSSDPNSFFNDIRMLGVKGNTTIRAADLGLTTDTDGYSVAVYVDAVNEPTNELYYAELDIFFSTADSAAKLTQAFAMVLAVAAVAFF